MPASEHQDSTNVLTSAEHLSDHLSDHLVELRMG